MAEEQAQQEDRTEAPTPRRREEAREQGRVARSADLVAAAMLLGFLLLLQTFGPRLMGSLRVLTEGLLGPQSLGDPAGAPIPGGTLRAIGAVGWALAPVLVGVVALGLVLNIVQTGWVLATKRLQPNLGVLNPLTGLGRIFAREGLVHLVMNLLKLGLVLAVAYSAVMGRMDAILTLPYRTFVDAFALGADVTLAVGLRVGLLLLVLAVLDYGWHRHQHEQKLRMTKQEVKEEMRHMEGDPRLRQRRRAIALQLVSKRLKKDVPTADVVITNPTHFAVALKYDAGSMNAPRLVAKGQDLMAQRIREIAREAGVPIVERPPLARALYRACDVGQEIPEQFYAAVAEILAYVYELAGRRPARATAGAA